MQQNPAPARFSSAFLDCARPAVRLAREIPVHLSRISQPGSGPSAAFLPAAAASGAALLRIYNIAGTLRRHGWRTLVLPHRLTLAQRHRLLAAMEPDILVMQGARHPLNRPALYPGRRVAYDMDDADFHLEHLAEPVRRAMSDVCLVLAGSSYVADWCREAGAPETHVVWTGAAVSTRSWSPQAKRPPVIAWAQTRPMTYVHEADLVRRVVRKLAVRRPGITLRLYDRRPEDDPAFAKSFSVPGVVVEWYRNRAYSDYLASFDDVALGFAPLCPEAPFSRGKSFGKVLAYLDTRVPVIASDACEHGAFFTRASGVVTNSPDRWVNAADRLLADAAARQKMADAAFEAFRDQLSLNVVAARVDKLLRGVISPRHPQDHQVSTSQVA